MNLVSLKRDKSSEDDKSMDCCGDGSDYPWGTRLSLGEDELEKLGIQQLPEVGGELMMHSKVEVVSVSSETVDGSVKRNLTLQITEMGIDKPSRPMSSRMYPEA